MLKMVYSNIQQRGDLVRDAGLNLESGLDLETAVLISLFTERRREESDILNADGLYKGGYWGDVVDTQDRALGSRLWTLRDKKATQNTVNLAKAYSEEALQWLLDDGVAGSIEVRTSRGSRPVDLRYHIAIVQPDGRRWERVWEMQLDEL